MNERIRELAEQTLFDIGQIMAEILCPDYDGEELNILVDAYNTLPKEIRHGTVEILRKRQEKFTQLIVQECVQRLRQEGELATIQAFVGSTYKYAYMNEAANIVKKHFGVEE